MHENCILPKGDSELSLRLNKVRKIKKWYLKLIMVNEMNPMCAVYYRSEMAIKVEKLRHITSGNLWIIHPFSKFRKYYEIWLIVLYALLCIVKPMDACTIRGSQWRPHTIFSLILDLISWSDIFMLFSTGYVENTTQTVELQPKKIFQKYVTSLYFLPDILGAIPRYILYIFIQTPNMTILGIQIIICLIRPIRIVTMISLTYKVSKYMLMLSKMNSFIICCVIIFFFTLHYTTCLLISVGRLVREYWRSDASLTDIESTDFLAELYVEYMFRSSAYLLGIMLPQAYFMDRNEEEYLLTMVTFIVGKMLIGATWIILAANILNSRSIQIKFQGILNQLEEYMKQKQLPMYLRNRIFQYYQFKYRERYFKDQLITTMLSESIRKEINMDMYKLLVSKVSLFHELSLQQMGEVVPLLVPEIYLESDIIIHAGSSGDAMYFLASGTVAVFTHSGKEVCHLEDGAYFGEISLVMKGQYRTASVIAVEICQIYKLTRKNFEKTLLRYKSTFQKIISRAESRLKETAALEQGHRKTLFSKTYTFSDEMR